MNLKGIDILYRDALSAHLRSMGLPEYRADYEANRIVRRWLKLDQ